MGAEAVALRFVVAINGEDAGRLAAMMTDDHVFIDSDGTRTRGRAAVERAWSRFFALMPAYRVDVQEVLCRADTVVLIGVASGGRVAADGAGMVGPWSVPAAWRAAVEGDRVASWQVFVNPEPMLAAMRAPPADAVRS